MEPQKSKRPLAELVSLFNSPDEVAPIDNKSFGRELGEIIERAKERSTCRGPRKRRNDNEA